MRGHIVADAGKFGELVAVGGDVFDAFVHAVQEFGGFFVAAVAADDGAVDFQELRGLAQDAGYVAIFHGGIIPLARGAKNRKIEEDSAPEHKTKIKKRTWRTRCPDMHVRPTCRAPTGNFNVGSS